MDTLKCSMTPTMMATASSTGVAIQNRLNSMSSARYSAPMSSRFSTNTKLPLVHIFDTKPQPTTGLDSCTRVPDWLTPHCSAATAAMSNTTNRTPYSQPGNGLYSRRPPFLPPLPPFLPEEESARLISSTSISPDGLTASATFVPSSFLSFISSLIYPHFV